MTRNSRCGNKRYTSNLLGKCHAMSCCADCCWRRVPLPREQPPGTLPMDVQADAALAAVIAASQQAQRELQAIEKRAQQLQADRATGASWEHIVRQEERPLIVEKLTELGTSLEIAGSRWRRTKARALHARGLTMDTIADLFGVTRQRISALLKS